MPKRKHKYNARKVVIDGIEFASTKEGKRYKELKVMQKAGVISDLVLQPKFVLAEPFRDITGKKHRSITYTADFQYTENGTTIVEDVKGRETDVWKIKKKLFLKNFPHELRVT